MSISFFFTLAKALLPIILQWYEAAHREGIMKAGEQRLLARQMAAYAIKLQVLNDIQTEADSMSGADIDDILSGRV